MRPFYDIVYSEKSIRIILPVIEQNLNKLVKSGFLRKQGINIKTSSEATYDNMNLEELMTTKEHLEDLIAEKELSTNTASAEVVVETETK